MRGYEWPTITAHLSGNPSGPVPIHVTSSDPSLAAVADFNMWAQTYAGQVPTYPTTRPTLITITASYNGVTKTVQFTINP